MNLSRVLFEFLGIQWTWLTIIALVAGGVPVVLGIQKLHFRWTTRKERRHNLLHEYLDEEEKDVSAKRRSVLDSIRKTQHSYLEPREFDVGREIDLAIVLLNSGHPEQASAKLAELEKRLETNQAAP